MEVRSFRSKNVALQTANCNATTLFFMHASFRLVAHQSNRVDLIGCGLLYSAGFCRVRSIVGCGRVFETHHGWAKPGRKSIFDVCQKCWRVSPLGIGEAKGPRNAGGSRRLDRTLQSTSLYGFRPHSTFALDNAHPNRFQIIGFRAVYHDGMVRGCTMTREDLDRSRRTGHSGFLKTGRFGRLTNYLQKGRLFQ